MNRTPLSARLILCALLAAAARSAQAADIDSLFVRTPEQAHASVAKAVERAPDNAELVSEAGKSPLVTVTLAYGDGEFAFMALAVAQYPDGRKEIHTKPSLDDMRTTVRNKKQHWTDVVKYLNAEKKAEASAAGSGDGALLDGLGAKIKRQQLEVRDLALAKAILDDIAKDEALVAAVESGAANRESDDALLLRKAEIYKTLSQYVAYGGGNKLNNDNSPSYDSNNNGPYAGSNNSSSNNNNSGSYSNNNNSSSSSNDNGNYRRDCEGYNGAKPRCGDQ